VDGLKRIDADVIAHKPTLVTVMFGLNDMVRVPLDQYRENLKTIIAKCRAIGAEVMVCTPNNVIDTASRPTEKLEVYCEAVRRTSNTEGVPLCDCYRALQEFRGRDPLAWRLLMSDEIHPNMDGHRRMAETMARSILGESASLDDVPPPEPALAKSLPLLRSGKPVKVLAMSPFDELIGPALRELFPDAKLDVITWPIADKTLPELERDAAARARPLKPNLVVLAVPRTAAADSTEAFIHAYAWVMNSSLSFGQQEWDCVVIHPAVADPDHADADRDALIRRLVRAQDLTLIDRSEGDRGTATGILARWLAAQTGR
jgi:hypothetical protein